jgi:hypothetical protein
MIRRSLMAGVCAVVASFPLAADFSYDQSSKITGGMMAGMMKVAGVFSKQAREPIRSSVLVKGDRMANVMTKNIQVIDLSRETFTDIDLDKKTYSVITFADFQRAMQEMARKMADKNSGADWDFNASVKNTGATRSINGLNAREAVMTLEMKARDQKSGQAGSMFVVTDMWLAPTVSGYDEVKNFYVRMAQKMSWSPMGGLGPMMQPQMLKGFAEAYKEMSKLEGIPVLQVIRMGGSPEMAAASASADGQQAQQPAPPAPSAGEVAGGAAAGAAAGRTGRLGSAIGGIGGFGGFGRRKKTEEQQAPAAQQQPEAAPQQNAAGGAPGMLMEVTSELANFSSAAVDAAKFDVPAGFKQVQHPLEKELKK